MSNINNAFLLDLGLVLGSLAIVCRLAIFRIKHKEFLRKNKPGTQIYEMREKIVRVRWLIISSIFALAFLVKLAVDANTIASSDAPDKNFVLVVIPLAALLIFGLIGYVGYNMLIKPNKK